MAVQYCVLVHGLARQKSKSHQYHQWIMALHILYESIVVFSFKQNVIVTTQQCKICKIYRFYIYKTESSKSLSSKY